MAIYGADIAELREAAAEFDRAARALDGGLTSLGGALQRAPWRGGDADRFRSEWTNDHSARIRDASTLLRDAARALRSNADAQETTSTDGGAGGSGGTGGTGGTGGSGGSGGTGGSDDRPDSSSKSDGSVGWKNEGEVKDGEATYTFGGVAEGEVSGKVGDADYAAEGEVGVGFKAGASEDGFFADAEAEDKPDKILHEDRLGNADHDPNELGVSVGGEAYAQAGAWAEGEASIGNEDASISASGEAFAGAKAEVGGGISLGEDGLQAGFDAGAFAGAEAKGTIGAEVMGVGTELEAGVRAGIGADASFIGEATWNKVHWELELGAALGVGFTLNPSITFSPSDVAKNIMGWFD